MKSILMVTTIPDTLQAFLLPFAKHFRNQGWQVDAMAYQVSQSPECLQNFDRVWDIKWSRNPLDPQNLLVAPPIIQQIVEQGKYDIVHVHTPVAAFVTRYALKNRKKSRPQVIYTAHGFHFYRGGKALKNTVFLNLEKIAGRWTDYLVVINREDEEAAKRHRLVSPDRIHYMPGIGVDLHHYNPTTTDSDIERVRQELNLTTETPLLLSVAELIDRKRPQDILKAFARLNRPQVCLAFAGIGPLIKDLQQLAFQLGIQNQVRFLGFRRDIPTLMRMAVASILASEQEGLPRCVMESMCVQTPVIATDIRGTHDLLTQDCGCLFPVGDIQALTNAIASVLDYPQQARMMGKRGRDRIAAFELPHIIKLHEKLYAEALSASQHHNFSLSCS
jgi:glycosyltransferase involved in cell wall biosynthesis